MAKRRNETDIGGQEMFFGPTLWTLILRAKNPSAPDRREALEQLFRAYWKPVYFFIRRRGNPVESAKDLTQSFFAAFLEKDFLKDVSPEKGRFRSFLLAAVTHFLSNEYDRRRAKKRGGHLNFVEAEEDLASADPSPDKAFTRQWTVEVLRRSIARLRKECDPVDFGLLAGEVPEAMSTGEKKNRLFRIRGRLRRIVREEILPSVESEAEAERELAELCAELA